MKDNSLEFYCKKYNKEYILSEWDTKKNGKLVASYSYGSHKKVWWKCNNCGNEWIATIKNRTSGTDCPKCANRKISSSLSKREFNESLAAKYPELLKEWNFDKNNINPKKIAPFSEKKAWWVCSNGHDYYKKIYERTAKNGGCPYCSGHKVLSGFNDLQTLKSELAKEWHPTKNGDLLPSNFTQNSNKIVWWKCSKGHEWEASINNRNHLNRGCPYCSHSKAIFGETDLESQFPEIAKQWNYGKNGNVLPSEVLSKTNKSFWWKCSKGHEWKTKVYNRTIRGDNCPYCSNQKVLTGYNDLLTTNPEIKNEWDYEKNKIDPSRYSSGSGKKVWWICSKGHSYQAEIHNRTAGYGCPYCANQKILKGYNDLETTNSRLAKEWDYEKNGNLKPSDVIGGSHKKVWWVCKNKHHYRSPIVMRNRGTGCPVCNKSQKSSFPEQAIFYYIKKVFPDAINGYKEIFNNRMELDIFIPSIKVGIEYDGMQFHSTDAMEKDYRKYKICKDNGIVLIRIKEINRISGLTADCDHKIEIPASNIEWLNWAIHELCFHLDKIVYPDVDKDRYEILSLLDKRNSNLLEINPNLANEWNYKKNKPLLPENVSAHSNTKVWWKCSVCGHEWEAKVANRAKGDGCPNCKLVYSHNVKHKLSDAKPDIAKEWNYEKNAPLIPSDVGVSSSKVVWWKCQTCGYEWKAKIESRNRGYCNCKACNSKSKY